MKSSRWLAALAAIACWCVPAKAQNSASGNISASSTNCTSVPSSCVWEQPLPPNAATTTINISGTFSATLLVEESNNGGATFTTAATLSSAGTTTYSTSGFSDIRVRCSAYVSGTAVISISTGLQQVQSVGSGVGVAFPPAATGQTQLTYDQTTRSFHVTRTDNTFGTVFILDNLNTPGFAARQNDFHHIDINVDGQADYTTSHFSGGVYGISSILDLDQDGHFGLAAGSGASDNGIATDPSTFEVCLGATRNPISCKSFATRFNTSSQLSSLAGSPTVGVGMAGIVFRSQTSRSSNLSFTIPALNGGSNTTSAACTGSIGNCPSSVGLYEIISVFTVSVAGSGSTLLVQVSYTDDVQAETNKACTLTGPGGVTTVAQSMVNVGDTLTADCKFWAAANTNITLVWTFAGTAPTVSAKTIMLSYGS